MPCFTDVNSFLKCLSIQVMKKKLESVKLVIARKHLVLCLDLKNKKEKHFSLIGNFLCLLLTSKEHKVNQPKNNSS